MKPADLHPRYAAFIDELEKWAEQPCLWQKRARSAAREARAGYKTISDMLLGIQNLTRLRSIFIAGLENDQDFMVEAFDAPIPMWDEYGEPPACGSLQKNMAQTLFAQISHAKWNRPLLCLGEGSQRIGVALAKMAMTGGFPAMIDFRDQFMDMVITHADAPGLKDLIADQLKIMLETNIMVGCFPSQQKPVEFAKQNSNLWVFYQEMMPFYRRSNSGEHFFTFAHVPTRFSAQLEGMKLKDLTRLYFEMADQPWHAIGRAQEQLIAELDAGKTLRFTNSDGTDLSMDIEDFTFQSCLCEQNVPGSEIFSAPKRGSVNGTIVAKGRFMAPAGTGIVENLTMEFNKGALVKYSAEAGAEHFAGAIAIDHGAKYIGEIGIGTNPYLKHHVLDRLMAEKIGGSFHVALGRSYTHTEAMGRPVKIDNGNKSQLHWDITTMLYGKDGRVELDGRAIMEDGKFVDPKYDVLNRGWDAIPRKDRPDYWKDRGGQFIPPAPD